ncbi:hypothetical protein tloyanaT_26140 [Thalassotalea loyana]|uniref:DUF3486 family protein n=1 Tax=Thalassotalea loyana TaxID=280483 RepID=A0ABQ6HID4_9GAMM|nr:DUF3486 family protein [Thalassotalea loyana]GLX86361.1 hypothetical protein tloyanaT_26140 [Thalassotalea loyana]
MTDKKKRGKASKIDLLPEPLKKELDSLLRNKQYSQAQILEAINQRISDAGLPDNDKISKSGLSRYSVEMETVGQEIRAMRESTEMWIAQFGDKPTGETSKLLLEMLRTQHFKLLMQANADPDIVLDPKTINTLALALNRLESASMLSLKHEKEIRKGFAEEAATEAEEAAIAAGLTSEAAQTIKAQILGIA